MREEVTSDTRKGFIAAGAEGKWGYMHPAPHFGFPVCNYPRIPVVLQTPAQNTFAGATRMVEPASDTTGSPGRGEGAGRGRDLNMSDASGGPGSFLGEAPTHRFLSAAICAALTLAIGFLDYTTTYQMDFSLFYFIPVALSAWFVGRWSAGFFVLFSVSIWFIADLLSSPHQAFSWFITGWNGVIHGFVFSLVALATSTIKKDLDQKHEWNTRLSETLRKLEESGRQRWLAEQETARNNEFLRHVFESLTHPFYVVDAEDHRIVMANSATVRGGVPQGATCYTLTHHGIKPCAGTEHLCPLEEVKRTREPFSIEHVHYDEDGSARHVEVHCYPVLDREGKVAQVIEYTLDVSRRKQLEEALRDNAEKTKLFAYSVSHDLRSPLIGIGGLTELLHRQYRDVLDERGRMYCDQIRKASENALRLIEEINVFIRTKEVPMVFERIDPKELLRTIRSEFDALLDARRIKWSEPESVPEIRADRLSLMRVFRNLADNALKYGGEGLSEITFGYEESEDFHVFSVADDGTGIASENCERIFELFQRDSTAGNVEGSGLGLSIVREIAEKHGGEVRAERGDNGGAIFRVFISKGL